MEKKDKWSRRTFLRGSVAAGFVGMLSPASSFAVVNDNNDEFKVIAGPYLQSNFKDNMVIQWLTNMEAFSWVEYGVDKKQLNEKAYGQEKLGFKPIGRVHQVILENLKPGVTYYYRIVSKPLLEFQPYKVTYASEVYGTVETFTAVSRDRNEVSFVMLNDIHDRPKSIPHLLDLDKGTKRDFVFFNGDMFDYQENEQQIVQNFLAPVVNSFARNIPFLYVRGNHETRGKFSRDFSNYFYRVGYQSFTLGPVHFVVLDCGEDKKDSHPVYAGLVDFNGYREEQGRLLEQEINSTAFKKARFRVVLMHIPPVVSEGWDGTNHVVKVFEPLMNKGKVDLVLSGHIHQSKIFPPTKGANNYPIITGGGPQDGNRTLLQVYADSQHIAVDIIGDNGQKIDIYTVKRS